MIERYSRPEMKNLWSLKSKFTLWLMVELAVLWARKEHDEISAEEYDEIADVVGFDVDRIIELDEGPEGFRHDMLAFIETCKEVMRAAKVPEAVIGRFHEGVTSYDIEDPAFCLQLIESADLILEQLNNLLKALIQRAYEHRDTLVMGLTHGQAAEVTTLAVRILNWADALERDQKRIIMTREELRIGKFSGAVGVYGDLPPHIEELACRQLELRPVRIATQIIHRDRHASYMSALCILASNLGHIAHNLWLMCQFPRSEAREPFGRTQRGSSAMPHKKNPIILERMRGMAAQMRGYLSPILEMVATYDERAIDQSSVERVCWPDATTLVHYMLYQLTKTVSGMEFFPDKMRANIDVTLGQCGSGYVKNLLLARGIAELAFEGETVSVYDWVQKCAFEAWKKQRHLKDVMIIEGGILSDGHVIENELDTCFDYSHYVRHADMIYQRFGI